MGASALVPSNERSTAVGETPRPMDATIVAGIAKILRIFYENPFLVKIFAAGLRRPFGDPPGALPGGQRSTLHRNGR